MPIRILQYGVKVRDPVTKQFNDLAALKGEPGGGTADALPLAGGTMSGNINMDSNKVTNLSTPTANSDAVPKSYTDNIVAVSDTQPTATENKLWVDTDAGTGSSYQVPTVAEMEAEISSHVPLFRSYGAGSETIAAGGSRTITYSIPSIAGYTPRVMSMHVVDTSNVNYTNIHFVWTQSGSTLNAHVFNTGTIGLAPNPYIECLYLPI